MTSLTYEDAEKIALQAIHDTDGRGMIGRGRNHLHQRVARALLSAARSEGRAEAPVVDDAVIAKALQAFNQQSDGAPDGDFTAMRAAILAALGASQ